MDIELNRALIVDDESETVAVLQMSLEVAGGVMVDTAHNGLDALARVEQTSYDVVLLDVVMPVMDGLEVLRKMIAMRPELAVIMVTVRAEAAQVEEYRHHGAAGVIAKPFDVPTLYPRVLQLLQEARDRYI